MANTSGNILQSIRNRVDTCESGWLAFAESAIPPYNEAYNVHNGTLKYVKQSIQLEAEQGWMVLGMVLSIAGGYWVPRLLKPVRGSADELVGAWVKDTFSEGMKHAGAEAGKEALSHISGTLLDTLKNAAVGGTGDTYEPAVETTIDWGARLKEGIYKRAFEIKKALDENIRNADKWSIRAAEFMERAFFTYCPFIIDMPLDNGEQSAKHFKADFRRTSELAMWQAWARARDENWWRKNPNDRDLLKMGPIFDRLVSLSIPPHEIADWHNRSGTTIASARSAGWRFNMLKFINWAKQVDLNKLAGKAKKPDPPEQVCRAIDERLILKRNPNACYLDGIH